MLVVLLIRRLTGNAVVDSLSGTETVEPAVRSVWDIVSGGLRERSLFLIVIGVAFVGAGLLAGPGRHATSTRRFLSPYLRDQPVLVYSVVAAFFIFWLTFIPGIENLGQVIAILALAVLAVVGVEALRLPRSSPQDPVVPDDPVGSTDSSCQSASLSRRTA